MLRSVKPTDSEIMERVQNGDHEVFGTLVSRYAPRLCRFAESKLGDAALAEDVVQETFLAAFAARGTYNPQFAVTTWLWTILLNLCRRHWRRSRSGSASVWEDWDAATADPADRHAASPLSELILSEDERRVHELLTRLPEVQADALRLRFFGGLSFQEIASTMDCSLSGAKRRVKTGLERLAYLIRSLDHSGKTPTGPQTESE